MILKGLRAFLMSWTRFGEKNGSEDPPLQRRGKRRGAEAPPLHGPEEAAGRISRDVSCGWDLRSVDNNQTQNIVAHYY